MRLFNPWAPGEASHLYTTSFEEYVILGYLGWNKEGVSFYGVD